MRPPGESHHHEYDRRIGEAMAEPIKLEFANDGRRNQRRARLPVIETVVAKLWLALRHSSAITGEKRNSHEY